MAERDVRERDILVASNEYAYVQDLTKGDIVLYVGPTKISLSNTERLVELRADRFVPVRAEDGAVGVSPFVSASSAQYIVLENPPKETGAKPVKGSNSSIELLQGRKVVVPGPATFPLWPGQKAVVVNGHALREDQYLRVRVYDRIEGEDLPIGAERIVKGSETSFYIPRTGLEVVPEGREWVRNAVTLLDGQYCILQGPRGERRFRRGPAVVFPEATEEFVVRGGAKVFAAHAVKREMGLHVRAVKAFLAGPGDQVPPGQYAAGQELFVTGQEGFFFPTESLEVLGEVRAIPLAEKEGIYVREIQSGRIATVVGPMSFLPDPTQHQLVPRPLEPFTAQLYGVRPDPARAVAIYVPPSYAVLVSARSRREVVKGPQTRILDFDEELEVLELSTGKPKSDEAVLRTAFLQTDGNKVSDVVRVKTADHVELEVALSYRVSFLAGEGESRWFNVKNYVALLCDHLGSIVRAAVRATPVDAFHAEGMSVIRNAVLGEKSGDGKRTGRKFEENGMWVYDVEILEVRILDADVKGLLANAQRAAIVSEVARKQEGLRLADERLREEVNRQIHAARQETLATEVTLEEARKAVALAKARTAIESERLSQNGRALAEAESLGILAEARATARARDAGLEREALAAEVAAFEKRMGALQPELIATLKTLGNQQLAGELVKHASPLAILGGDSVASVVERLLSALPIGSGDGGIAKVLPMLEPRGTGK